MSQDGSNGVDHDAYLQVYAEQNTSYVGKKSREWVFTCYTMYPGDELPEHKSATYISWQHEQCGTTGRDHYQGYAQFQNQVTLGGLRKWLPATYFAIRASKSSPTKARNYTRKDDTRASGPWERGLFDPKESQGKRNDLEAFKVAVQEGVSWADLIEEHSEVVAKHPGFVALYRNKHQKRKLINGDLNGWQVWIRDLVDGPVNDRAIYWFYDPVGGAGKTWMSKWLMQERTIFYNNGGKANDLCFAYNGEPIVVFDYVRKAQDYVAYGPMEQLKNGIFFSPKYQSMTKSFDPPHVLVFANFLLDKDQLSKDRIHIIHFKQDAGIWWQKPNTPIEERID